jgi:hypothetical protein
MGLPLWGEEFAALKSQLALIQNDLTGKAFACIFGIYGFFVSTDGWIA